EQERRQLLNTLGSLPGHIILVSNETGMGVVPMGELSRRYVDEAGWLHQALAERCDRVEFCVGCLPMLLKGADKSSWESKMTTAWWLEPVAPVDLVVQQQAWQRQQQLTKPAGALGQLERVAVQLAAWQGDPAPQMQR